MQKGFSKLIKQGILLLFFYGNSHAQLSGNYNVPITYSSIAAAIADLNLLGVSGPVFINIPAGYIETAPAGGYALTASGTSLNPITFRKIGVGTNPLITAFGGGIGTPSSANQDGVWRLVGADYITIDGIDINDPNLTNPTTMEYGYGLFKLNPGNGCQNNTIQNCSITLKRVNNATGAGPAVDGSRGINMVNSLPSSQTTILTPTSAAGSNSNNKFYANTIQNCNIGIALIGYAASSPFTLADTGNEIGSNTPSTGNTITNYGGATGATNPAAAISTLAQYNITVLNNSINNNTGAGVNHVSTLRGIYLNTAISANATVSGNTITLISAATSAIAAAIENVSGATASNNTISISSNLISNCTNSANTSGSFYGIYNNGASADYLQITNNVFSGFNTQASTGSTYLIYNTGAVASIITITNNLISNCTHSASSSGNFFGIQSNAVSSAWLNISNNTFTNVNTFASSGSVYNIYNTSAISNSITMISNTLSACSHSASSTGSYFGIYNNGTGTAELNMSLNSFQNNTLTLFSGSVFQVYNTATNSNAILLNSNSFLNSSCSFNSTGSYFGIYNNAASTADLQINNTVFTGNTHVNTSGSLQIIYNSGAITNTFNTISITNNLISSSSFSASGAAGFYSIWNNGVQSLNTSINSNTVINAVWTSSTAINYLIANFGPSSVSANVNNNLFSNCTSTTNTTGNFFGIYNNNTSTISTGNFSANSNTFTNIARTSSTGETHFINVSGITTNTYLSTNMNNNSISGCTSSISSSGPFYGIYNNTASTNSLTVTNNTFSANYYGAFTGPTHLIYNRGVAGSIFTNVTINSNIISGITNSISSTGPFYGLFNSAVATSSSSMLSLSGNTFTNTAIIAGSSPIFLIYSTCPVNTSITINSNNFSDITNTLSTTGTFYGINNGGNSLSGDLSITNNIFSNLNSTASAGSRYLIYNNGAITNTININTNLISNCNHTVSGNASYFGIYNNSALSGSALNINTNTISANSCSLTSGSVNLILNSGALSTTLTNININSNTVNNFSFAASTGPFFGIANTGMTAANLSLNTNTFTNMNMLAAGSNQQVLLNSGRVTNSMTISNNIVSSYSNTLNSTGIFTGISNVSAYANGNYPLSLGILNNKFLLSNMTSGTGAITFINNSGVANNTIQTCDINNNEIANHNATITAGGGFNGINSSALTFSVLNVTSNSLTNIVSSSTTSARNMIFNGASLLSSGTFSNNLISDFSSTVNTTGSYFGINNSGNGLGNLTVSSNTFMNHSLASSSGSIFVVSNSGIINNTIDINTNYISNVSHTATTAGGFQGIYNNAGSSTNLMISANTFTNINLFTSSGATQFIFNRAAVAGTIAVITITNTSVSACSFSSASGPFYGIYNNNNSYGNLNIGNNAFVNIIPNSITSNRYFIYNTGIGLATSTLNIQNNLLSNFNASLNTLGNFYGIFNQGNSAGYMSILSNTLNNLNLNASNGQSYMIYNAAAVNASDINNNLLSNHTNSCSGSGAYFGIFNQASNASSLSMNSNTISNTNLVIPSSPSYLIYNNGLVTNTINAVNIANNSISNFSLQSNSGNCVGIYNNALTSGSLSVINNSLTNSLLNTTSASRYWIYNSGPVIGNLSLSGNYFTNSTNTLNTTGSFFGINNGGNCSGSANISNNSIFNHLQSSTTGSVLLIYNSGIITNSITVAGNSVFNFTNTSLAGSFFYGVYNNAASSTYLDISSNTFTNISHGTSTGSMHFIYNRGLATNTINSITFTNNILSNVIFTASSGPFYGLYNNATSFTSLTVNNNSLATISSTTTTSPRFFIYNTGNGNGIMNVNANLISNFTGSFNTTGPYNGINNGGNIAGSLVISNNTFSNQVLSASTSSAFVIYNSGIISNSISISSNLVSNFNHSASTSGGFLGIYNNAGSSSDLIISANTFTNLALNSASGPAHFIYNRAAIAGTISNITVSNNLLSAFDFTSGSGPFYGIYNNGHAFSNLSVLGNSFVTIATTSSTSPRYFILNNGIGSSGIAISNNNVSSYTSTLNTSGLFYDVLNSGACTGNLNITNNTFTNHNLTATTGTAYAIHNSANITNSVNISNNLINGSTFTSTTGFYYGLLNTAGPGAFVAVSNNSLSNISITNSVNPKYLIYNTSGSSSSIHLNANVISNYSNTLNTSSHYVLYNTGSAAGDINLSNNTLSGLSLSSSTAAVYLIHNTGTNSSSTGTIKINQNTISNLIHSSSSGSFYGCYNTGVSSGNLSLNDNSFINSSITTTTSNLYILYNTATVTGNLSFTNNLISNNTNSANTIGGFYGLYNSGVCQGSLSMSSNSIINNFLETNTGLTYLLYNTAAINSGIQMNANYVSTYSNSTASGADFYGILNTGSSLPFLSMNGNTFSNNNTKATSGNIQLVANTGSVNSVMTFTGNTLGHGFTNTLIDFSGNFNAIYNSGGALTSSLNISGNNFSNFQFSGISGTGNLYFIHNTNNNSLLIINGNTWTNLNLNHNGNEHLIYNPSSTQASLSVISNSVIGGYTRSGTAGPLFVYYSNGNSPSTCTQNFSNNNFSNFTANTSGTGSFYGLYSTDGLTSPFPKKLVYNNIISNISYNGLGFMYGYYFDFLGDANSSTGSAIYNNTLTNISWGGPIYGLYSATNLSPNYAVNIYSNVIQFASTSGQNADLFGAYINGYGNGLNFYKNKISDLTSNGTAGTANGIFISGSGKIQVSNNLVGNIHTPFSSASNALNGVQIAGGNPVNVYYNTVLLNATSTGSNFASNALYALSSVSMNIQNNIFINNSSPNGNGISAAYRRSSTALSNYSLSSNNNVFYAGVPATNHVLYHDGTNAFLTLPSFQTQVTPRENLSISENSPMLSTLGSNLNFLHINTTVPSLTDNGAINAGSVTDDFDAQVRQGNPGYLGVGTAPDIGADEYNANLTPCAAANAGTVIIPTGSTKCSGETVYMLSSGYTPAGGIVHQWKVSNTPGGPYSNVVGGTGANYVAYTTSTLNAGIYYYVLVTTCTIGSLTGTSNEVTVTVNQTPTVNVSISNQTLCSGQSLNLLSSGSTGTTYAWFGPNNFTSTVQNPVINNVSTNASGIYTLLVSNVNCTSSPVFVAATVHPSPPQFSLTPPASSLCAGSSQTIGASVPVTNPTLNFGSHTYQNSASGYPAPYSVYYGGQKMQMLILAGELAVAGFTVGSPISSLEFSVNSLGSNWGSTLTECKNFKVSIKSTTTSILSTFETGLTGIVGPLSFTPVAGINNIHNFSSPFIWDGTSNIVIETVFSNSIIGTAGNTVIQNNSPTSFQSTLVYRADNQNIAAISAATTSNVNVGFVRPDFKLNGAQVGTYSWSPSTGLSSTNTTSVIANPVTTTIYTVSLFNGQCTSTSSILLNVILTPTITISSTSSLVCLGNNATLTAAGAATYTWSSNSTATSIVVAPFVNTTYTVTGSNPACPNASNAILILAAPALSLTTTMVPATLCQGQSATITATGASNYTWTGGSNSNSISVTPSLTTNYNVFGSNGPGCWTTKTVLAKVNPIPFISISPPAATICPGQTIALEASGVLSFTWMPGGSNSPIIEVSPKTSTVYLVTGVDLNSCVNTASILVTVDPCVSISETKQGLSGIDVYPNPSSGIFKLDFNIQGLKVIHVLNVLGSLIDAYETQDEKKTIDLSGFEKGIYFVKITSTEGEWIKKVILH